jgi:hypothetical protein
MDVIMTAETAPNETRLAQRAESGDASAQFDYARLVLSDPRRSADGPAAIEMLESAASKQHPEAVAMTALFEAMGALRPQNWLNALNRLQEAAELGSQHARAQLLTLAPSDDDEDNWAAIRKRVDLQQLLTPPPRQTLSQAPRIIAYPGFATPQECDWAIARARDRLKPATVFNTASANQMYHSARDNSGIEFQLPDMDVVIEILRARISAATRLPVPIFEPTQILHYAVGEQFRPHHDFFDPEAPAYVGQLKDFGQRIATVLVYLSDDYTGGETVFPKIGLSYRGRKGDALFFANVDRSGQIDPMTLHAGTPPTSGEKWVLSQWIRDRLPAGNRQ